MLDRFTSRSTWWKLPYETVLHIIGYPSWVHAQWYFLRLMWVSVLVPASTTPHSRRNANCPTAGGGSAPRFSGLQWGNHEFVWGPKSEASNVPRSRRRRHRWAGARGECRLQGLVNIRTSSKRTRTWSLLDLLQGVFFASLLRCIRHSKIWLRGAISHEDTDAIDVRPRQQRIRNYVPLYGFCCWCWWMMMMMRMIIASIQPTSSFLTR